MALISVGSLAAQTQQPATPPQRDANGLAVIRRSLLAMGGADAIAALKDSKTEGTCTRVNKTGSSEHPFRWITKGNSFRYDNGENDQRGIVSGPAGDGRVMDDKVIPASGRTIHAFKSIHFPGLMLSRNLRDESNAIELLAPKAINGITALHVRVTDVKASANTLEPQQEDWYFDQTSGLPLRVEYSAPAFNSLEIYNNIAVEWSQYKQLSGFVMPQTTKQIIEGGPTVTCNVNSFTVNSGPDDSVFSLTPRNRK